MAIITKIFVVDRARGRVYLLKCKKPKARVKIAVCYYHDIVGGEEPSVIVPVCVRRCVWEEPVTGTAG